MNKSILLPLFAIAILQWSFTTPSKYEEAMKENIEKIYEAHDVDAYQQVINNFDRIAQMENDKWEPLYYASFGYVMMATQTQEPKVKDQYLDLALQKVKAGLALNENEDELIAMEGFIHMIRVTVDPATRGQQYSGLSMQALNKAVAIDPENPRALYLLGQMELGTARFFGSDTSSACEKLQRSIDLFENNDPESAIAPAWGHQSALAAAKACDSGE